MLNGWVDGWEDDGMESSFTLWSHSWSPHLKKLEVQCHKIQEVLKDNNQGYPDQRGQLVLPTTLH